MKYEDLPLKIREQLDGPLITKNGFIFEPLNEAKTITHIAGKPADFLPKHLQAVGRRNQRPKL